MFTGLVVTNVREGENKKKEKRQQQQTNVYVLEYLLPVKLGHTGFFCIFATILTTFYILDAPRYVDQSKQKMINVLLFYLTAAILDI